MWIECRVRRAVVKVRPCIAAYRVVSTCVHSHPPLSERTLILGLKGRDVRVVLDKANDLGIRRGVRSLQRDIAAQTARIVPQAIRLRIRRETTGNLKHSLKWSHVDLEVFEGAGSHATAACSRLEVHVAGASDAVPGKTRRVAIGDVLPIARHARSATVEERAALRVLGIMSPVVIWKSPLETTLVSKHLFIDPGEVPMPRQEVSGAVDGERLLDMSNDQVVVATLCARRDRSRGPRRQLVQAINGIGVGDPLLAG